MSNVRQLHVFAFRPDEALNLVGPFLGQGLQPLAVNSELGSGIRHRGIKYCHPPVDNYGYIYQLSKHGQQISLVPTFHARQSHARQLKSTNGVRVFVQTSRWTFGGAVKERQADWMAL